MSREKSGMRISGACGLGLVLLACILAVGAGLIAHFATRRSEACPVYSDGSAGAVTARQGGPNAPVASSTPATTIVSLTAEEQRQQCQDFASNQNECYLTDSCPSSPGPSTTVASSTSPRSTDKTEIDVRLPEDLDPVHYELELQPYMYDGNPEDFFFTGKVTIQLLCKSATERVILHMLNLEIDNQTLSLKDSSGVAVQHEGWEYDKEREFLILPLSAPLTPGETYSLYIQYRANLTDSLGGLYWSRYDKNGKPVYIATTQMQPTDARRAFPCFDEPAFRSNFSVTLVRKSHMISLGNMPQINFEPRPDDWVADKYDTTPKMPTYILAFIVCDFSFLKEVESPVHNTKYRVFATEASLNQTAYALDIGPRILDGFWDFFNVPYPLPKQDMIAVPDFAAGAMENWGLITYRETALLYDYADSAAVSKAYNAEVVAHELAHMWFGNLVTPEWWDDLWLNEGFATYVSYIGMDFVHKNWQVDPYFVANDLQSAMDLDALASSHPLWAKVATPDEINEIFDAISYAKGASVIRMAHFFLGNKTFVNGLTNYLTDLAYGNAQHGDLWKAWNDAWRKDGETLHDAQTILDTFVLQMGYPVVTLNASNVRNGELLATQEHFLLDPTQEPDPKFPSPFDYKWYIPLTVVTKDEPDWDTEKIYWIMKQPAITVPDLAPTPDGEDWIIGNARAKGYYRVNYDLSNWRALTKQLKDDHQVIEVRNRGQLVDDAMMLSRSGRLAMDVAMNMSLYLSAERHWVPLKAWDKNMDFINDMLRSTAAFGDLQAYSRSVLEQNYNQLSWERFPENASIMDSFHQALVVGASCRSQLKACETKSWEQFVDWKENGKTVNADLRSTVYCQGVRQGGEDAWDYVWGRLQQEKVPAEQTYLRSALSCTGEQWLLARYLELALNPDLIRPQDLRNVLIQISRAPGGREFMWSYFTNNFDELTEKYKTVFNFGRVLTGITEEFNTEADVQRLKQFGADHPDLGQAERALQQVIERTESNIRWMNANYQPLADWLKKHRDSPTSSKRKINVRLPRDLDPLHYEVELQPDLYGRDPKKFRFSGKMTLTFHCLKATNNIVLHVKELDIPQKSIRLTQTGVPLAFDQWQEDKEREFFTLPLKAPLQKGQQYVLSMTFSAPLKAQLGGLYLSQYTKNNQTRYMATTQMQATDARRAFPCMDEPSFRSNFSVTLLRKSHMVALSNMNNISSTGRGNDWVADKFATTPKMPTYLLAFVVCDFTYVQNTNGSSFRVWTEEKAIDQAKFAIDFGPKSLKDFEDFFKVDFPLPKQDMIAIPDFGAGAMENWGLITYRETALLYDQKNAAYYNLMRVAEVIAHELAHQWFGNLVTPSWWDDLWLNEGFATYMAFVGMGRIEPQWEADQLFINGEMFQAFALDSLATSHPLYAEVATPAEISEIFDSISYSKGGAVVRFARSFLGEKAFIDGLTNYLTHLSYGNAFHDDLWEAWHQEWHRNGDKGHDVKAILDTWTLQMGYPLVTLDFLLNGQLRMRQKHFLLDKSQKPDPKFPSPFNYTWYIPVTLLYNDDRDKNRHWLKEKELLVNGAAPEANEWVIANKDLSGFYRVNYPLSNWRAIIKQLHTDHSKIPVKNRAQLINDAFALARAGELDLEVAMNLTLYLSEEREFLPLSTWTSNTAYLRSMLRRTSAYGNLKAYFRKIIEPTYKLQNWTRIPEGSPILKFYIQDLALGRGCSSEVAGCAEEAQQLFRRWVADETSGSVNPDLRSLVYCMGVEGGSEKDWDLVWLRAQNQTLAAEADKLRAALTCTDRTWLLARYIEYAVDETKVRRQDATTTLIRISASSLGRDLVWDYFVDNYDFLVKEFDGFNPLGRLFLGITNQFNTQQDYNKLRAFVAAHPEGGRSAQQAVETTASNVAWMQKNYQRLADWLQRNV